MGTKEMIKVENLNKSFGDLHVSERHEYDSEGK